MCALPERAEVDRALTTIPFAGFADVARRFPRLSEDSLSRHAQNHLRNRPRGLFRDAENPGISDSEVTARLLDAANAAKSAREALQAAHRHNEVARATVAEARVLQSLRRPPSAVEDDAPRLLRDAHSLARAVGRVARLHPDFGQLVVSELRAVSADELAEELSTAIPYPRKVLST